MTLYDMLSKAMYEQRVWIYDANDYDQHVEIFKGDVEGARTDTDSTWFLLMNKVELFYIKSGILVIFVEAEKYDERLDGWRLERSKRNWMFSCEIDKDLKEECK